MILTYWENIVKRKLNVEIFCKFLYRKIYNPCLSLHDLRIEKEGERTRLIFDVDVPDSLLGEKQEIADFVNVKLKEVNPRYEADITFDPMG